jgi:hypothetical protein
MNFEIKKEDWGKFFDNLSKRRFEWNTEVEVLNTQIGDQGMSIGLPLIGVTLETLGEHTTVDISVGEHTDKHQTHNIKNPTRIAYLASDNFHADVVNIEEADGTKTLLRFTRPSGVMNGFAGYEMAITAD